jgi:hypothetical protein
MNCDQVFDILTRGPFPTGTWCDEPVEAHLAECAECHRLAEALRPAIELFQEAVDPEESRDLPGYFRTMLAENPAPALSFKPEIEVCPGIVVRRLSAESSRSWSSVAAWRTVAMVALGMTAGLLLSSRMDRFDWPPRGSQAAVASGGADPSRAGATDWEALAWLPMSCFGAEKNDSSRYRLPDDALRAHPNLKGLGCCSGCHNSQSRGVPPQATLLVAQSCRHCHERGDHALSFAN